MRDTSTSTIAQLLFVKPPRLNFAHMVGELDCALARCPTQTRRLSWDCEDMAIFDLDDARIVLGYVERPGSGHGACLTATVGPQPGSACTSPLLLRSEAMCRLIVERIQSRFEADAILWHRSDDAVTTALLDDMTDALPPMAAIRPARVRPIVVKRPGDCEVMPDGFVANDAPHLPPPAATELCRVRAALYPEGRPWEVKPVIEHQRAPVPQRLAVHALNATLVMVSLPVGAAMVTYAVLRGEDLHLSGRAMALTGAVLAFTQSQMGQTVMAMI